ncbi:hypothetical protein DQ04_05111040 [Trypanosoma grayi]|uniref:hypothetical protein n=1 Tax=Trypanosoma grayi TaxID=71804 RepID=UPI0004F445B3|nr:hypothetical protein DQ04_05111040 [Trypanosoma grayi]KEG09502.1 hypothetical protein DQ04_05111040 [Trypanosoma grayi]
MYAVMTELARENQSRCRLLMQQYYEEYAERKGISTGGVVNRNDDHGFIAKSGRAAAFENDGRWELPRLELRFHLKCGGVLRETAIIVETDNDALK